jgi:hypothetical protein
MSKTQEIASKMLRERMAQAEIAWRSAEECLDSAEYLQCAVRLEMIAEQFRFDEFQKSILDSISEKP